MPFFTKKQLEEEIQKRIWEEQRRNELYQRLEGMDRRIMELDSKVYNLRMMCDEDFRKRNMPTCDCVPNVAPYEG